MNELLEFSLDTENAEKNYNLAKWYENQRHTAPAHSYYLRAAERAKDNNLAYQALIRASFCYKSQGSRDGTELVLLENALNLLPQRPEAYYFLSLLYERKQEWQNAYTYANLGLQQYNHEQITSIDISEFCGKYQLIFQKAISAWWWGKSFESRKLLNSLVDDYWNEMDTKHQNSVTNNLANIQGKNIDKFTYPETFDWGDLPYEDVSTIEREVIEEQVYRFWNDVKENDVVLDIGASVGAYTISILDKNPKQIYCVEPSKSLINLLEKNCTSYLGDRSNTNTSITYINNAIVNDRDDQVNVFGSDKFFTPITFSELIHKYAIKNIDFMKVDCEGGEYSIFTEQNLDFIINHVKFIAIEIHLKGDGFRDKFKQFRDNFLTKFKNYKVMSCTRQNISWGNSLDIKSDIFDDYFIDNYNCEFMIYISNESCSKESEVLLSQNSKPTSWIVDNFYEDPYQVREFALNQDYVEGGFGRGFIGRRTEQQFLFPGLKERFEEIMGRKIIKWEDYGMNGRFQIAWSGEPLVYHCDSQKWGGMIYLTPDAPYECGTTLYAHKKTRARTYFDEGWDASWKDVPGDCHLDGTPFEPVDVLGNVYNRLVIFDASAIHSASKYFGTVKENARLWQMFFFDTE